MSTPELLPMFVFYLFFLIRRCLQLLPNYYIVLVCYLYTLCNVNNPIVELSEVCNIQKNQGSNKNFHNKKKESHRWILSAAYIVECCTVPEHKAHICNQLLRGRIVQSVLFLELFPHNGQVHWSFDDLIIMTSLSRNENLIDASIFNNHNNCQ